nr:tetratricopeptide repeat protein [Chitinophagaceae bacterium]
AEVSEERNSFKNQVLAVAKSHQHLILEPINWELDMVHSNYPGLDNAQAAINPLILDCDLIVFVMYSKIGKFTREEFEYAEKQQKPYFIYFKTDYSPTLDTLEAYTELLTFKKELQGRILPVDFKTTADFDRLLFQNLNLYLSRTYPPKTNVLEDQSGLQLSETVKSLLQQQTANNEKIDQLLKLIDHKPSEDLVQKLEKLQAGKENILLELASSKEIIALQQQDKKILEERLQQQQAEDQLKADALKEIQVGNYEKAEELLLESNRSHQIKSAANYFELANIKKLQFLYQEASKYLNLAVQEYPTHIGYLFEASQLELNVGYVKAALEKLWQCLHLTEKEGLTNDEQYFKIVINLANALYANRSDTEAYKYAQKALELCIHFKGENHVDTAVSYSLIGLTLNNIERYQEAIEMYKKAETILTTQHIRDIQLSGLYNNIGLSLTELGKADEALDYFNLALEIDKDLLAPNDWIMGVRQNNMGRAFMIKGKFEEALTCHEKAVDIGEKTYKEGHPDLITFYENYANALIKCNYYPEAMNYAEKALKMAYLFFDDKHVRIGILENALGTHYLYNQQYEAAIEMFNKSLIILLNSSKNDPHFRVGNIYNNIGECYRHLKQYELAEQHYQLAKTTFDNNKNSQHSDYGVLLNNIGLMHFDKQEFKLAVQYFTMAVEIFEKNYGENHPNLLTYYNNLAVGYQKNQQPKEAEIIENKLKLIQASL